jgi:hypothetical protein
MLTPDGQVKILDFGLARFAMEAAPAPLADMPTSSSLTQIGTVMGTPDYIAPEQARDAHTADIRADIYSLGCTLYDLLSGHAPFYEGTVIAKITAHMERMPQPLCMLRGDVPAQLSRVVERMMAKDPAKRFQTPAEVAAALAAFASPAPQARGRRILALTAIAAVLIGVIGFTGLGGAIYRIVTNQGELIIEVGPGATVVLQDSKIIVEDHIAERSYDVKIGSNQLRAGKYELHVTDAAGLNLFTKEFAITRNGRTEVSVKFAPTPGSDVEAARIAAGTQAAKGWLEVKEAGEYEKVWEGTSSIGQKAISKKDLIATYDGIAKKLGKLKSRAVYSRRFATEVPGTPPGQYVLLEYKSSFERWANTLERVTMMLEQGQWRVAGYFNFMQLIPPDAKDIDRAVRAGLDELTKDEQKGLEKDDPNLADLLADPGRKMILDFFAHLPDSARQQLVKDGYLKWKFAAMDPALQKSVRDTHQQALDHSKKLGASLSAGFSLEALDKGDTGFALINVPGFKHSIVSWYFLFPAEAQPGIVTVVGPKPDAQQLKEWSEAHLVDINALRTRAYSKTLAEFARTAVPPTSSRDKDRLQGTPPNGRVINTFGTGYKTITRDGITEEDGTWRIETKKERLVRLYEVQPPLEDCIVTYRAKVKCANLDGKTYLTLYSRMPFGGEFFSKGIASAISGTRDWITVEIPFMLQKDDRPDLWKLCLQVDGAGTVWLKDIELWQAPLPAQLRRPSNFLTPAGFTPGTVKHFNQSDKTIASDKLRDVVSFFQSGWHIDGKQAGVVPMFEVTDFRQDECAVTYRAQMKSSAVTGRAFLETVVHLTGEPEDRLYSSRDWAVPLTGTCDWTWCEASIAVPKGQHADRLRLNIVIEGGGTVWLRDVELLRGPLAK